MSHEPPDQWSGGCSDLLDVEGADTTAAEDCPQVGLTTEGPANMRSGSSGGSA